MDFVTAYDDDKPSPKVKCTTKTKTKQSLKKESDINYIVERFMKTGNIDALHLNSKQPVYSGDNVYPTDYQTALQIVADAEEAFEALPSQVKKRFPNIGSFVDGFEKLTLKEAQELGLSNPVVEQPVKAEVK